MNRDVKRENASAPTHTLGEQLLFAMRIPMVIDGQWRYADHERDVIVPFRGDVIARMPEATALDLEQALESAVAAKAKSAATPGYVRAGLLHRVAELLRERLEAIVLDISRETGKAIKDSRSELLRSVETITLSAEEAVRIEGEHVPLDATKMGAGKIAMLLRFIGRKGPRYAIRDMTEERLIVLNM